MLPDAGEYASMVRYLTGDTREDIRRTRDEIRAALLFNTLPLTGRSANVFPESSFHREEGFCRRQITLC